VIDALDLGFFASSFARSAAFRLSDMVAAVEKWFNGTPEER